MNGLKLSLTGLMAIFMFGCTDREELKHKLRVQGEKFAYEQHTKFGFIEKAECKTLAVVAQDESDRFFESLVECKYTYSAERLRNIGVKLADFTRTKTYSVFMKIDGEDMILQMPSLTDFKSELVNDAIDI